MRLETKEQEITKKINRLREKREGLFYKRNSIAEKMVEVDKEIDSLNRERARETGVMFDSILYEVAFLYRVGAFEILSNTRIGSIQKPRCIIVSIMRNRLWYTYNSIWNKLGHTHGSIIYIYKKHEQYMKDNEYNAIYHKVIDKIEKWFFDFIEKE